MSTLVHELRSPISSIEMAISMLEIRLKQKGLLLNPDHYLPQYLNMLRQECDRSIRLADDLQTGWMKVLQADSLGGADAVVMEDDSLPPLERQAIADLSAELTFIAQPFWYITRQRGQIFKVAVPQSLPSITTNHSAVTHILTELLTQACRYTPAGETITLSASLQPDGLALRLVSTGVEIPSSQLPFLFKPYHLVPHHLRWQRDETGLGLPLVKQLTEQIGATIQVDSMAQQTTFTVLLPV
jgi:signal transduction histidine kinase